MKPPSRDFQVLATVSDYCRHYRLPPPSHPLLTLIDLDTVAGRGEPYPPAERARLAQPAVAQFYTMFLKRNLQNLLHYGHQTYDFSEGVLGFTAPGQVLTVDATLDISCLSGWVLVLHPDLVRKYPLGQKLAGYGFFSYQVHEALHVSAQEEQLLASVLTNMRDEYERPIDAFSQDVLVAQLEQLLAYANRFYHRQFLTRRAPAHDQLSRFEALLASYFASDAPLALPTVQHFAGALHLSPAYLSDLLRAHTGQSTQQHLHQALVDKAKSLLLTTSLTVNETAFRLGFEYPQYFNRLFKRKTGLTPAAFRQLAN